MNNVKRHSQYKFKFYLNASHSICIKGELGNRHTHTWEISIHLLKIRYEFIRFTYIETQIEALLDVYQDKFINEQDPFNIINPTLENICNYFKTQIRELVNREGWILLMIEISETPARSYVINLLSEDRSTSADNIEAQEAVFLQHKNLSNQPAENLADMLIGNILTEK